MKNMKDKELEMQGENIVFQSPVSGSLKKTSKKALWRAAVNLG